MDDVDDADDAVVTVYWRPGCGFCSALLRSLDRHGLDVARVNIWDDPDGAAFVRSVTGGNETVPTVRVGEVALVNPTTDDVMRIVSDVAPSRLPPDYQPREPGRMARAMNRLLGG